MADNTTLNPGSGGDVMRSVDRSGVKTQVTMGEPWFTSQITSSGLISGATVYGGIVVVALATAGEIDVYNDTDAADPTKLVDVIPSADVAVGEVFSPSPYGLSCSGGVYVDLTGSWSGTVVVMYR